MARVLSSTGAILLVGLLGLPALDGDDDSTAPAARADTTTSTTEERTEPSEGNPFVGIGLGFLVVLAYVLAGIVAAFVLGVVLLAGALGLYHGVRRLLGASHSWDD